MPCKAMALKLSFDSMMGIMVDDDKLAFQPSFLKVADTYAWGDVLKGIEKTSHNFSAALLMLDLGTMSADCFFDQQVVVYEYSSFVLWVPYGVSDFYLLSCYNFTLSPLCFIDSLGYFFDFTHCCLHRNNTGDITTSFSNMVILTRNVDEDVSDGAKLRLRAADDGKLEYRLE